MIFGRIFGIKFNGHEELIVREFKRGEYLQKLSPSDLERQLGGFVSDEEYEVFPNEKNPYPKLTKIIKDFFVNEYCCSKDLMRCLTFEISVSEIQNGRVSLSLTGDQTIIKNKRTNK